MKIEPYLVLLNPPPLGPRECGQRLHITDLALVVQMLDSAIQQINIRETNCTIHRVETYPVDNVIHLLDNWGLFVMIQVVE